MSRRKRTQNAVQDQDPLSDVLSGPERDAPAIANPWLLRPKHVTKPDLLKIEDRRAYDPSGPARSARQFNRAQHSLVTRVPRTPLRPNSKFKYPSSMVGFAQSSKTLICVRRKTRKEVIIAKKLKGYGARRRNYYSSVFC